MTVKTRNSSAVENHSSADNILSGVVVGLLVGNNDRGQPLVVFPGNKLAEPVVARSAVAVSRDQLGREIALMFEHGDPARPILMGLIENLAGPDYQSVNTDSIEPTPDEAEDPYLEIDGKRIDLEAEQQITLKCGKASITLTRAGKVIIRGTYLLNRSSGVNRIKGGSVQIN